MNGILSWKAAMDRAYKYSSVNQCRTRVYGLHETNGGTSRWRYYFTGARA